MLNYTKANVNTIAVILAIILFIVIQIVINCFFTEVNEIKSNNIYNQGHIYSKIIPINSENNFIQSLSKIQDNYEGTIQKTIYEKDTDEDTENNNIQEESHIINAIQTEREVIKTYNKSSWRIEIPRINLNVHILEGTSSDVLLKAVGHFEKTSKWKGNVGLAAHNRGYNCNFFKDVEKLQEGDEIIYYTTEGKRVYKIIMNKIIEETNWNYLKQTEDNRITLITCVENRKAYRRCVQAVEVKI